MKALFVSNDPSIFEEGSDARMRMRAYAIAIGELAIVSTAKKSMVIEEGPLTLYGIRTSKLMRPFALRDRARAIIKKHGIEVVSAQDPFEHGWAAMKAVKGTSAKLHVQVHTDFLSPWFTKPGMHRSPKVPAPLLNHLRLRIADTVLTKAQGIRAVSTRVKDSLVKRYGNRIPVPAVIPIGARTEVPDPVPLPSHTFPFALITVGRLEPEKRIEDILHALARVSLTYPSAGLVIVGDGSERPRLEKLVRSLGLENRVVFAGEQANAWGMMRSAQAYIQASAYEGYGRTLIEAALAGIPIITTDVGIVGDVLIGYEDVLSAPPCDPAALATHIAGLLADHHARATFVQSAKQKAMLHLGTIGSLPDVIAADLARTLSNSNT